MSKFKFDYIAPKSFEEASQLLLEKSKKSFIMAGGTDLLLKIRQKLIYPKIIISVKNIEKTKPIYFKKEKGLIIKSNALLSEVLNNKEIIKNYPTLAMAAKSTANTQIRNMGTLIGNICNASPAADNIPTLLAMNSIVNIHTPNGNKKVKLEKFFIGPNLTILKPGEIVTSIFVPILPNKYGSAYYYISQRSKVNCSTVGVSVMLSLSKKKFKKINIFIGGCGPTIMRATKSETILFENILNKKLVHNAALEASREMNPITDIRATAKYRKKMIYVMTKRAINTAIKMSIK